jgi:hypothetical protein
MLLIRRFGSIATNVLQLYAVACRLCAVGKLRIGAVSCCFLFDNQHFRKYFENIFEIVCKFK